LYKAQVQGVRIPWSEQGVLYVRRSDNALKRNAEIGLFTKPSINSCC